MKAEIQSSDGITITIEAVGSGMFVTCCGEMVWVTATELKELVEGKSVKVSV